MPEAAPTWKVLMVDDEPSVHEMTRLILAGMTFEGRAVELLAAGSAAQARELLTTHDDIALALVDVVMETDDAGIVLVEHIRETLDNHDMQIVLRTGQPGMAPELEIVRRCEINAYHVKTDITAQRLHSIVISALRSWRHARSLRDHGATPPAREPDAAREALATEIAAWSDDQARPIVQVQPEVRMASHRISGLEFMPQWKTSLGLLSAARIFQSLRDPAVQRRMTRRLLRQACDWARTWQAHPHGPLGVSLPGIGECLASEDVVDAVLDDVAHAGLARGTIDLLVSEAVLLGGEERARTAVAALRAAGLSITLVDFGVQTISLQRLSRCVPDRLKLHRLFVRGVTQDPERMALARSLIALAQTLQIVAVADGVSSDTDAQFFRWEGCELGQGDALAPACALSEVNTLVDDHRPGGRRPQ